MLSLIATQLVRTKWGINVALVGGNFSPSRFLDLNSFQRKAGMVVASPEQYIDQTNVSMSRTSSGSSDGFQQTKHRPYMLLRRQIPSDRDTDTNRGNHLSTTQTNTSPGTSTIMTHTMASSMFSVITYCNLMTMLSSLTIWQ